eukprot:3639648-Rhodomonas_salina.2
MGGGVPFLGVRKDAGDVDGHKSDRCRDPALGFRRSAHATARQTDIEMAALLSKSDGTWMLAKRSADGAVANAECCRSARKAVERRRREARHASFSARPAGIADQLPVPLLQELGAVEHKHLVSAHTRVNTANCPCHNPPAPAR